MSFKTQQQLRDISKMIEILEKLILEIEQDKTLPYDIVDQKVNRAYKFTIQEIKNRIKS